MKRRILFLGCFFLILAGVWGIGFVMFVNTIFAIDEDIKVEKVQQPFGIAVLTGGRGRIERGIDLLEQTGARTLLISGVSAGLELEDIAKRDGFEIKENMPVELGYEARDTVGNAKEIKLWAEKHELKSVIGVTSSYHILRSRLEILHEMPEVLLEFAAVRSPYVKKDWWNSFESFKFLAAEYSKFLAVFVQYYVFRL